MVLSWLRLGRDCDESWSVSYYFCARRNLYLCQLISYFLHADYNDYCSLRSSLSGLVRNLCVGILLDEGWWRCLLNTYWSCSRFLGWFGGKRWQKHHKKKVSQFGNRLNLFCHGLFNVHSLWPLLGQNLWQGFFFFQLLKKQLYNVEFFQKKYAHPFIIQSFYMGSLQFHFQDWQLQRYDWLNFTSELSSNPQSQAVSWVFCFPECFHGCRRPLITSENCREYCGRSIGRQVADWEVLGWQWWGWAAVARRRPLACYSHASPMSVCPIITIYMPHNYQNIDLKLIDWRKISWRFEEWMCSFTARKFNSGALITIAPLLRIAHKEKRAVFGAAITKLIAN